MSLFPVQTSASPTDILNAVVNNVLFMKDSHTKVVLLIGVTYLATARKYNLFRWFCFGSSFSFSVSYKLLLLLFFFFFFFSQPPSRGEYDFDEALETSLDLTSRKPADFNDEFASLVAWMKRICQEELRPVTAASRTVPTESAPNHCCVFCKRNGETWEFFSTHSLKDNRGKVICPVLRSYVCPNCHATGDAAHTLRHCPVSKGGNVAATFKTPRTSCNKSREVTPEAPIVVLSASFARNPDFVTGD
ncbi:uncharacterized protein LOC121377427 [Gigantopelta aegis]|uniref:uncharacterized protein LOC121377427 n=1 Tax=Gigantopelta aegis TaxID=1735272 RepID=UPI001B88CF62|nr:uncharacterized protein LOC121377427 [Gigantopelta aegis]